MKLQQGQIWKKGEDFFRIVEWARMSIDYKAMKDPISREGTRHVVSKKEFWRLIKGAELWQEEQMASQPDQPTLQPEELAHQATQPESATTQSEPVTTQSEPVTTQSEPLTMMPRPGNGS